jgi:hypothetical protein
MTSKAIRAFLEAGGEIRLEKPASDRSAHLCRLGHSYLLETIGPNSTGQKQYRVLKHALKEGSNYVNDE